MFQGRREVLVSRQSVAVACDPCRTLAVGNARIDGRRKLDRRTREASVPIEGGGVAIGEIRNRWVRGESEVTRACKLLRREASVINPVPTAKRGLIVNAIGEPKTGSPGILRRFLETFIPSPTGPAAGKDDRPGNTASPRVRRGGREVGSFG